MLLPQELSPRQGEWETVISRLGPLVLIKIWFAQWIRSRLVNIERNDGAIGVENRDTHIQWRCIEMFKGQGILYSVAAITQTGNTQALLKADIW